MTCIIPKKVAQAEEALKAEGLSLANFHTKYDSTEKRVEFLSKHFNSESEAQFFNKKFERFLLNNQKARLREWVQKSAEKGLNTDTTKTLLEKIDSIATPLSKDQNNKSGQILNGLIEQKLGFGVTDAELKLVISANNNIKATADNVKQIYPDFENWGKTQEGMDKFKSVIDNEIKNSSGPLLDYGLAVVQMKKIYDQAKVASDKKSRLKAETKFGKLYNQMREGLITTAGFLKSTKASIDLSVGRQLSSALLGHPKTWAAEKQAFEIIGKYFKGGLSEEQRDTFEAMIYCRPNHMNGVYRKLGVAVGIQEEAYPETFLSKGKWNPFAATEFAFTMPIQLARATIADELYIQSGGDLGLLKEQGAGKYVNMITGRGDAWFLNENVQRYVNTLLFSPRWLSSRIQVLFDLRKIPYLFDKTGRHVVDRARGWAAVRQFAFLTMLPNLLMGLKRAYDDDKQWGDDDLERIWNSMTTFTSSDFGKFVVGDTRFDASMGYASLLSNAAKMARGYKTTVSGVKREQDWGKTLGDFFNGKMSPIARTVTDTYKLVTEGEGAKDFMYQPITWQSLMLETFAPITLGEGLVDLFTQPTESKSAQVAGIVADFLGIGANTYGISEKDLGKSKELKDVEKRLARKENRQPTSLEPSKQSSIYKKLKGKRQEQAIADYSKKLNIELNRLVRSNSFRRMKTSDQAEAMKKVRQQVNKEIKKKYGLK